MSSSAGVSNRSSIGNILPLPASGGGCGNCKSGELISECCRVGRNSVCVNYLVDSNGNSGNSITVIVICFGKSNSYGVGACVLDNGNNLAVCILVLVNESNTVRCGNILVREGEFLTVICCGVIICVTANNSVSLSYSEGYGSTFGCFEIAVAVGYSLNVVSTCICRNGCAVSAVLRFAVEEVNLASEVCGYRGSGSCVSISPVVNSKVGEDHVSLNYRVIELLGKRLVTVSPYVVGIIESDERCVISDIHTAVIRNCVIGGRCNSEIE